jgi:hypothetical protein
MKSVLTLNIMLKLFSGPLHWSLKFHSSSSSLYLQKNNVNTQIQSFDEGAVSVSVSVQGICCICYNLARCYSYLNSKAAQSATVQNSTVWLDGRIVTPSHMSVLTTWGSLG